MIRSWKLRLASLGLLLCGCLAPARGQEETKPFRSETRPADAHQAERAGAVAAAIGFAGWPKTSELYLAPAVSRVLFRDPAGVSEEVRACTDVSIGDEPWPLCTWSWKALGEGRKPSAEDWLDLQIFVAPSGRAAQEHLIGSLVDNQMATENLVAVYKTASRPKNLGHAAVVVLAPKGQETTTSFIRGNLAFRIRGHGTLAAEVLPLAAKLDESLIARAPLTLEELRTRTREKPGRK